MESKETRKLSVILNSEEARAKGLELAEKVVRCEDAKSGLKAISKRMKEDIEKLEKEISVLSQVVKNGKEDCEVECFEVRNNTLMTIETYRTDTGEMVATRPMTANERQLTMFPKLRAVDPAVDKDTDQKQVVNGEPMPQDHPDQATQQPIAEITVEETPSDPAPVPITEPVAEAVPNEQGATQEAPEAKE